jgi:phosphoenolpyruvate---glycerone phosphotransferase subunit DhaL
MHDTLSAWLRLVAERIHEQAPALTALDQKIGDGDHGTNLDRGFTAVVAALDGVDVSAGGNQAAAAVLKQAGRTLISTVGGAAGPLYGTGFIKAAAALGAADGAGSADQLVAALDAAVIGISGLGKATTGEKTMLDALVPALDAGRTAATAGGSASDVSRAMADAAEAGATATIPLLATKGRASYLGERSIGHQDPGATSAALLLRALADSVGAR